MRAYSIYGGHQAALLAACLAADTGGSTLTHGRPPESDPNDAVKEYSSVTIVVDHLVLEPKDHSVVKVVYSTETAEEAISAQLAYFERTDLLLEKDARAVLDAFEGEDCAFVLVVGPQQTQIVLDAAIFEDAFARNNHSHLQTHASLIEMALLVVQKSPSGFASFQLS